MKKYPNMLIPANKYKNNTSDPFVLKYKNMFYHCYGNSKGVYITESKSLYDIGNAECIMVYDGTKIGLKDWYAPELHIINDEFYIYVAPEYENGIHSMCVLKSKSENPVGEYEYLGQIKGLENQWSIDGTVFEYENKTYFLWSGVSELCLSEMKDAQTILKNSIVISCPEFAFETKVGRINEGPAVLKDDNGLYVIYSANDSATDEYCLGMIEFRGGDILNPGNWHKKSHPVFEKTDEIFGPGHCSFITMESDGKKSEYMLYHANIVKNCGWNGRNVFMKKIERNKLGEPVFGHPVL